MSVSSRVMRLRVSTSEWIMMLDMSGKVQAREEYELKSAGGGSKC